MSILSELLRENWISIRELGRFNSCRVIWKFGEFGLEGKENTHLSTGYWMHLDNEIIIDNSEMNKLNPIAFIPVYEGHCVYENSKTKRSDYPS